jgi:hypothetical protein
VQTRPRSVLSISGKQPLERLSNLSQRPRNAGPKFIERRASALALCVATRPSLIKTEVQLGSTTIRNLE